MRHHCPWTLSLRVLLLFLVEMSRRQCFDGSNHVVPSQLYHYNGGVRPLGGKTTDTLREDDSYNNNAQSANHGSQYGLLCAVAIVQSD